MKRQVRVILGTFIVFAASVSSVATAQDISAKMIQWAHDNSFAYKSYIQYANHPPAAKVPVPPELDPPCHLCGDTTKTASETQVDAWVTQNENPEMQYATALLQMSRDITLMKAMDLSQLTPAAQKILTQFDSNAAFNAAKSLVMRIYTEKAVPMANQYDQEPKRAYAGIMFLLRTSRDAQLIGGDAATVDAGAIQLAQTWESALANKIDEDILSGHKYNLCPVYASIIKSVELLGGPATNVAKFTETLNKMDKLLHFNVKMDMNLKITDKDGGHTNISWTANGKLHIKIDGANACYTPEMENGGKVHVNVTNFDIVGQNGEVVSLVSSRSYDVPFKTPTLNLCDKDVMLTMPFNATDFQLDTIEAHGHTSKQSFFGAFLAEVATVNNIGSSQTNKLSGRTPDPGPAPTGGSGSSPDSITAAMLQAHKNDPGWFMSPEGQKAIADMQKQAMATTKNAAAAKGVQLPNAGSLTDMMNAISSVRLKWTNGSSTPAQDNFKSNKDNQTLTLNVTVQGQQ